MRGLSGDHAESRRGIMAAWLARRRDALALSWLTRGPIGSLAQAKGSRRWRRAYSPDPGLAVMWYM